jgi:hypothetical protein
MRYVNIPDIRDTQTWKNPNAARLYMYMMMSCNPKDMGYRYSRRWTCKEIGITEDAYRHALVIMERDGLIRKQPPKKNPKEHPNEHPDTPPHIIMVKVSELYDTNPPGSTPSITPSSTPAIAHNVKINKILNLSHPRVREVLRTSVQDIKDYCHVSEDVAMNGLHAFAQAMNAKGKVWESTEDAKSHCLDWILKHYLREKSVATAERTADQERQRAEERAREKTPEQERQDKIAYRLSHLFAVRKSDMSKQLVTSWHQAGVWYDDELRRATAQAFEANPGLREETEKALGFDVLLQSALHL